MSAQAVNRRRVIRATLLAAIVAAVLLVTAILPAEYGIDLLGAGRALGLTALSGVDAEPDTSNTPAQSASPTAATAIQTDTYEIELRPFEGVEYKYRLEKGAAIVYRWTAAAAVEFEFHGEPDGAPEKYFDSYIKGEGRDGQGGFVAEKAGVHGWFWKNKTASRVKVTLHSSGFYASATEYRDGDRVTRTFSAR